MTEQEFEMLTEEQKWQLYATAIDELSSLKANQGRVWHFKPSYAFQCAEADIYVSEENKDSVLDEISTIVDILKATAPEQPEGIAKEPKKKFIPATEKQIAIMDKFGIKYPNKCSVEEAQNLIKKSIEQSK